MRIPDFHIHTYLSPDGHMDGQEAVESAIKMGVTDLCFTEHMDLGHHLEAFNRVPDFDKMQNSVEELRKKNFCNNFMFAFQNGKTGDIMVQKAPACTIATQAQAVINLKMRSR